jgi:hypothetical protein
MRQQKRVLSDDSPKDEREVAEADEPAPSAKGVKRQAEVVILSRPPEPAERISWIPAVIGLAVVVACSIATTVVIMSSQSASSSRTPSPGPTLAIPPTNAGPALPSAAAAQASGQAGVQQAHVQETSPIPVSEPGSDRGYLERIAQHPDDPEAWTGLGDLQRRGGQLGDARRSYARALQSNDRFFPAALAMADMGWDEGDRANSQKQYAALVANFPTGILPARVLERAQSTP